MNRTKVIDPILALATSTLAERRDEPRRLAVALKRAANRQGFRRPKRKEFIGEVISDLGELARFLNMSLARSLDEQGPALVQNAFFRDYLLRLQTGYLHQLVSACIWADYLTGKRSPFVPSDPRSDRLRNLEHTLQRLLQRPPSAAPSQSSRNGATGPGGGQIQAPHLTGRGRPVAKAAAKRAA